MRRALFLLLLACAPLGAQLPRTFYAWWSSPVANNLNLTPDQRRQIRAIVQGYRGHLQELRITIDEAERQLATEFDQDPVDTQKANQAIDRLAAARADLTKTLSQMSLRLRALLTQQQWQELQRRRPHPNVNPPTETER